MVAEVDGGRGGQEMAVVSEVVDDLTVTLVLNEEPAHFEAKLNAAGLPLFEDVIKTLAKFDRQHSPSQQAIYSADTDTVVESKAAQD